VLSNARRAEVFSALLSGLKSPTEIIRYKCAVGLVGVKAAIATNAPDLANAIQALKEAGTAESSPVVLGRIYEALSFPNQAPQTAGVYLAIFDARLDKRSKGMRKADLAESFAFDALLAEKAAIKGLSPQMKSQFAARAAGFLRHAAARYGEATLAFAEVDALVRLFYSVEEFLVDALGAAPPAGGAIRDALQSGGHGNRAAVATAVALWIGDAKSNTPGALNAAPWSVPLGAP
jgi:hypothetical protein